VTLVTDASVACTWFIGEAHSDRAEELLAGDPALIAPDLIVPEVCNVAWLKLRRGEISSKSGSIASRSREHGSGACSMGNVSATATTPPAWRTGWDQCPNPRKGRRRRGIEANPPAKPHS
jgi:hypothetical protein